MHSQLFCGDVGRGGVERLDVLHRPLQELGLAQILKARVSRHGKVRGVDLQIKPGGHNRLVFWTHGVHEIGEISLVRGVMTIWLKGGDEAGRCCIHEAGNCAAFLPHSGGKAPDIVVSGF